MFMRFHPRAVAPTLAGSMHRSESYGSALALVVLLGACSGAGLDEIVFPEEPLGINGAIGSRAIVYGTGRSDLWAPVPGKLPNGDNDPAGNHVLHYDGSRVSSMPLPSEILALPGGTAAAWAAGAAGELWMAGPTGGAAPHRMVVVSQNADGTIVDHSSQIPALPSLDNVSLRSGDGVVVLFVGGIWVRFASGAVEVLPAAPAGSFPQPVAVRGGKIYATSNPSSAPQGWLQFDGSTWSDISLPGTPGPIGFSFFGDDDGWAFGTNHGRNTDNTYPLYRFDGSWSTQTIIIDGQNNWTPSAVLATGRGTFAVISTTPDGDATSIVYRTGTTGDLSSDETLGSVDNVVAGLAFLGELDDGTFLMSSGRGGPQLPTRVFAGSRGDLK
ncbi:MAG: hypothetical protein H6Q90_6988 [Deltaproteobacteria bacterium]|nr:hypothetical protein [Deltaproteobacteria bacterium]